VVGQAAGGGVAVVDAELAAGAVAIGIHRGLRHAQLAGDLLRAQVTVHQAQAFALSGGQKLDGILGHDLRSALSQAS